MQEMEEVYFYIAEHIETIIDDMLTKKISYHYPSLSGGVPWELIRLYMPKNLESLIETLKEKEYVYYLNRFLEETDWLDEIAEKMAVEYFIRMDLSDLNLQVEKYKKQYKY